MDTKTSQSILSHIIIIVLLFGIFGALHRMDQNMEYMRLVQDPVLQEAHAKVQIIAWGKKHPEVQQKILDMLAEQPAMTYSEVRQVIGLPLK